jgi:histidyl-tRNA synthetase
MPARWYSIPNLFRYEKPQKGRLREHWQLNADIFGSESPYADAEVILLALDIMKKFGATSADFEIRINSRALMDALYKKLEIPPEKTQILSRIIDKKDKISKEAFIETVEKESGDNSAELLRVLESKDGIFELLGATPEAGRLSEIIAILEISGIKNLKFCGTLTRGFDYYTGMVFEIFDTNEEKARSLFGGGRYDDLINAFSNKNVPAAGFGMGDVAIADFLYAHNLCPKLPSATDVWLAVAPGTSLSEIYKIANKLRENGVKVGIDISGRKLGDQIASAEKRKIRFVAVVGNDELKSGVYKIRNMETREEKSGPIEEIIKCVK